MFLLVQLIIIPMTDRYIARVITSAAIIMDDSIIITPRHMPVFLAS